MKKIIISSILAIAVISGSAQQLTYNSQYMQNQFLINPAAAGLFDYMQIAASFRQQWAGFNDAPRTQMLSANTKIGEKMGVGGIVYNDVTGPLRNIGFQGSYSYHLKINEDSKLALGLSMSAAQHVLDGSSFNLNNAVDATLNGSSQKSFNIDATFGVYYYADNYFVGLSVPQLFQNKYKFGSTIEDLNRQVRHYYFSGGYKFDLGGDYKLEPSVLLKYVDAAPLQFDINAKLYYKNNLWAGVSYRDKESVVAMLGMQRDQFIIGYSYDYTTSNINNYSGGTH